MSGKRASFRINLTSILAVGLTTLALLPLRDRINSVSIALVFLAVIVLLARLQGSAPALLASIVSAVCFNFFFLPPYYTLVIAEPQNWIALIIFLVVAATVGQLSATAKKRAEIAERLYAELKEAFEQASHAEALKRSEKLKSALLDAVTHDLRTPLTAIKASVTTLLDSEGGHRTIELDADERREFLDVINEEADRLNKFIESMVELARVEAGGALGGRRLSNVEEMITMAIVRAENIPGRHRLSRQIASELPLINVDGRALAEALYNVLENAAKYSPEGSLITIRADKAEGEVSISVSDQGRGIPAEMRERVFDKFVRLEGEQSTGLGLGLSVARGIVESQGGHISICEGEGGSGTCVTMTLPAEDE